MKPEEVIAGLKNYRATAIHGAPEPENQDEVKFHNDGRAKALKQQLTEDEKDFVQYLTKTLPPIIGRAEVDRFLPGLLKPQTLAQADSAGLGPEVAWRVGRKIAYRTDSLVLWLVGRCGIQRMVEVNKFLNLS